ncbi:MAG TPA: M3 family metallopeptidase [Candidatus Limnocylindrales bacterium]|nr:M3 family metallopeptidase [Candidatus Limnocylindrales bacterium]
MAPRGSAVFEADSDELSAIADAAIAGADDILGELPGAVRTGDPRAPLRLIDRAVKAAYNDAIGPMEMIAALHEDHSMRDAAGPALVSLRNWFEGLAFQSAVGEAVTALIEDGARARLDEPGCRLLDRLALEVRQAGYGLAEAQRDELKSVRGRIVELEQRFCQNLGEWEDGIDVGPDGLAGLPEEFVATLANGEGPGSKRVGVGDAEYYPFMEQASRRDLREALHRKWRSRAVASNRPLLEEILALRRQAARLLGYPSWAHVRTDGRMAGDPEQAVALLGRVVPRMREVARRDLEVMTAMLQDDGGGTRVEWWDWQYYDTRRIRAAGADMAQVTPYLPLDVVLAGMFRITGEVFGIRVEPMAIDHPWASGLRRFAVHDARSGGLLGTFIADLASREGKAPGAFACPIHLSSGRDGPWTPGELVLAASLPPAGPSAPSLLRHDDVVALFHEFGHVLHGLLGRPGYGRQLLDVEWDFVEAPSQIMEHWAWSPDVLVSISQHYRTGEPLPRSLAEAVASTRLVDAGLKGLITYTTRAEADLEIHGEDPAPDLDRIDREMAERALLPAVDGTFRLAGVMHFASGYDAGFYGYLWAKVIGDDLFSRFEREGMLDPGVGADFRREILEPAGGADPALMVERFLGRASTEDAYLRLNGLAEPVASSRL